MAQRFDTSYLTDSKPDVALQSPLETAGKVAQYRNLLLQGQVHQQQIANEQETLRHTQQVNQELARKNQSMAAFEQSFHAAGGDPKKTRELAIQNNVDSDTLMNFDKGTAELAQKAALASKEQSDLAEKHTNLTYQTIAPIAADTDPVSQGVRWEAGQQALVKAGVKTPEEVTPYAGPSQVQGELAKTTYYAHVLEAAKEQRAQNEEARKAAEAVPKQAEAEANAEIKRQEATGEKLPSPIEIARLNEEKARNIQTKTNEEAQRKIAQQNADTAAAHLGIARKTFDMTFGEGANPALQNVEPKMRVPAAREAAKITEDYNKKVASAADMQSFLDMARSGNKAAGTNLPIVTVGMVNAINGIKRMNRAEIAQNEHMGSLVDKITGFAQGVVVGQPVPKAILDSLDELKTTLSKNADESYSKAIEGVDNVYRSNYKSVLKPKAAASGGKINVISPEGVPGTIDADKWDAAQKRGFKRQ